MIDILVSYSLNILTQSVRGTHADRSKFNFLATLSVGGWGLTC